jgi:glycosyltransferase involved in cell wall biosynthesis
MELRVCFLGSSRYSEPLDPTSEKKFRLLKELGQLFVVSFHHHLCPRRFTEHASFYLLPDLPLPLLRYVEMFVLGPLLALWLIFRHGVQILVAQGPHEGFAAAVAKKIANFFGSKTVLIIESHGDFEVSLFLQRRIFLPRVYSFLMKHAASFALVHADMLRAVSHSTRQQLESWAPAKPMRQFPTWTDIEVFLACSDDEPKAAGRDILYAGVLVHRKGVHHLINAFAKVAEGFPQAHLLIIGKEDNKTYAIGLKRQVQQLGLGHRVEFLGALSQPELAKRMRKACVFVLPSYSEGLPRVVFEAMAVGIPVIASAVSGIPEIIENGLSGFLVEPGNESKLAESLQWIICHPQESLEIGKRAQKFARRFVSAESYVSNYKKTFDEALSLRNGCDLY